MLALALEAVLFPFQFQRPALAPLFQFPPTFSTGCTQDPIICFDLYQREKCLPFNPSLKEAYSKGDRQCKREH